MRVVGETAGWFADPAGRFRYRYWDGGQWTDQVLSGTTREEVTDALEAELRLQPPRPVLPTGAVASSEGGARLLDAPPAEFGTQRTLRLPRPTPGFIAAVLLVGLVVGVTVWLVGKLAGSDSNKPVSVQSLVSGSNTGSTYPAIQSLGIPDATGLHFVADPALPGDRRAGLRARRQRGDPADVVRGRRELEVGPAGRAAARRRRQQSHPARADTALRSGPGPPDRRIARAAAGRRRVDPESGSRLEG